jgi:hypothetical protein
MKAECIFLFVLVAWLASAQSNTVGGTASPYEISQTGAKSVPAQTNQAMSVGQRAEQIRADCIQNRRSICGKILNVFPSGLVVESGYTNLLRAPLTRSWLVPGTVTASRTPNLIEGNTPDAICVGLVFITDLPKSKRFKPKKYDYVIIEGFPSGQYTYTSLGTIQRTVREFTTELDKAVAWNLRAELNAQPAAVEVK